MIQFQTLEGFLTTPLSDSSWFQHSVPFQWMKRLIRVNEFVPLLVY